VNATSPGVRVRTPPPHVASPRVRVRTPPPHVSSPGVRVRTPPPHVSSPRLRVRTPRGDVRTQRPIKPFAVAWMTIFPDEPAPTVETVRSR
jgi:hypothetical protein